MAIDSFDFESVDISKLFIDKINNNLILKAPYLGLHKLDCSYYLCQSDYGSYKTSFIEAFYYKTFSESEKQLLHKITDYVDLFYVAHADSNTKESVWLVIEALTGVCVWTIPTRKIKNSVELASAFSSYIESDDGGYMELLYNHIYSRILLELISPKYKGNLRDKTKVKRIPITKFLEVCGIDKSDVVNIDLYGDNLILNLVEKSIYGYDEKHFRTSKGWLTLVKNKDSFSLKKGKYSILPLFNLSNFEY